MPHSLGLRSVYDITIDYWLRHKASYLWKGHEKMMLQSLDIDFFLACGVCVRVTINNSTPVPHVNTVAYLGHGEKTNYSANPPGRNNNPPGRNSQSARAK